MPSETPASPSNTSGDSALSARERRAIRMIPFIVGCALFMQMLDATVVATALPVMAQSLNSSVVRMNVAITSYLLAVAVFRSEEHTSELQSLMRISYAVFCLKK